MIVAGGVEPGPVSRDDKRIVVGVGPAGPCGFWFRVFESQFVLLRVRVIALMTREPRDRGVVFGGIGLSTDLSCGVTSCRVVPIPNIVAKIGDGIEDKPEGNEVEGDRDVVHGNWRIVDAISMRLLYAARRVSAFSRFSSGSHEFSDVGYSFHFTR